MPNLVSDYAEVLLQPRFTGEGDLRGQGHEQVPRKLYTAVQYNTRCHADIGENLYVNVLLSIGVSMFQGIVERMTKELAALVPSTMRIKRVHRFGVDRTSLRYLIL